MINALPKDNLWEKTFGKKPVTKLSGIKAWNIIRINLDTNISDQFRIINTNDESIPRSFCKRFNGLAIRNDWEMAYIYREQKGVQRTTDGGTTA